jgi:predicted GNAT superfamily acetyltransferase
MAESQDNTAITIRALESPEDFRGCVRLQKEIWSFSDEDALPVRLFIVCRRIGGQIFGAFDGEEIIGFCVALPGLKAGGGNYLHSNMLGVRDKYRDHGLGRRLKQAQRDDAMTRGIGLIEWTFDPLETRNARFNIENLAVICRRFYVNTYGISSSQLQAGLPTDRLVAEWHLDSARVKERIFRQEPEKRERAYVLVELPLDVGKLKSENSKSALQVQLEFRQQLLELLDQDYCVTRFEIDQGCQKARYFLEPFDERILDL